MEGSTSLDGWALFNIAVFVLFLSCYLVLLVRHWRDPRDSTLIGGGRIAATAWVLGLIAIVATITLPISEAADDRIGLGGCLLMLAALVGSRLGGKTNGDGPT